MLRRNEELRSRIPLSNTEGEQNMEHAVWEERDMSASGTPNSANLGNLVQG